MYKDGEKVLRAKIDMASPNINMRDPVIYRVARMSHHNTGDKWCIYPMYDFAPVSYTHLYPCFLKKTLQIPRKTAAKI